MRILAPAQDGFARRARAFYVLTKPRVNTLIVFCAVIGMFLAVPAGLPEPFVVFCATVGIACVVTSWHTSQLGRLLRHKFLPERRGQLEIQWGDPRIRDR